MPSTSELDLDADFQRFKKGVQNFAKKLMPEQLVAFQKKLCFEVLKGIVLKTPVDTGRARNNWQLVIGENDGTTLEAEGGYGAIDRGLAAMGPLLPFDTVTIFNNLPYIVPLEEGHSDQAGPGVMVRGTLHEIAGAFG